jgi:hypothetical protein
MTTSMRRCCCAPFRARGRFRFRWSGARRMASSPSTWACTTCPAHGRMSGWRRWRISRPTPSDARLTEILRALARGAECAGGLQPSAVGPLPDRQGEARVSGQRISAVNGNYLHALELNGLRNWDENRAVRRLAEQWNMLLISGGDRHGVEPNANLNLTQRTSFTEFVHEIRREKKSDVLFMPQYAQPWKHRILQSTIDAIRHYPGVSAGLAHMGRARLSSGCARRGPAAERVVAQRTRAAGDEGDAGHGAVAGRGAALWRVAAGMEREPPVAAGAGRVERGSGVRGVALSCSQMEARARTACSR